ncbi:MAG: nucleotidyltransferase, partial [Cyclobacteriaceae bacterium]
RPPARKVEDFLDCCNKQNMVETNQRYLEQIRSQPLIDTSARIHQSVIIPPVFIGADAVIENSVVGPYVSVGEKSVIQNSRLQNSIVQSNTRVTNALLSNSMLGNFVNFEGHFSDVSLGDYGAVAN